jgi:hypothetical protein
MKKFLPFLMIPAIGLPATFAHAGTCHGTAKAPVVVKEEVDVTVEVAEPATVTEKVEVVVAPTSVVASPSSGLLVRKNARKEKQATIAAAREGRRAARFAAKASDAVGQESREEAVMKAYQAE